MADDIPFDRRFDAVPGVVEKVAPGVRRILAPNAGPFTFTGTCSYIIGEGEVAVLDPGPADEGHLAALLAALEGERVSHILLTHTHRDHCDGLPALKAATGALVYAEGPYRPARPLRLGEANPLDAASDHSFRPDVTLVDGERIHGSGWTLEVVATPGHTANHVAFALEGEGLLFSGDHVMAWATTIVGPPDGAMGDYMASLHKLAARSETVYLPGHGGPVRDAPAFVARYIRHREARESAILRVLQRGPAMIPEIVRAIYIGLDPRLVTAAGLSTLAHLEEMVARGEVSTEGEPAFDGVYRIG
ncbi:MBL fold metallo-hydrolase [Ancylobacter sp. 6x-1]|uniref:MBL fold metallo-hydrolase n=1 Tax=Ancylobacter crimeensis TaxID=2579147 RepID=A0ABT0DAW7_9HYPH|nr:MBL fold metallo-hydrolase [Ancylobacter crimeensis]MCK0197093.1 MBL fold metallo-hydrolase [Ancylobacter crimeensis]